MRDRTRRLVVLAEWLLHRPRQWQHLGDLAERLGVSKSTLSEDVTTLDGYLQEGHIESQVGALGGIRLLPKLLEERCRSVVVTWIDALTDPERMTPDGFLYMADLLFNPALVDPMGELLAYRFRDQTVDYVATVETKGIPLALATARALGVSVVLLRRDNRLSEGSALSINYLSGSSRRIQSMSLARRVLVRGRSLLFVDDFLKAGGTARAAQDLLHDVSAEVVGVGVLMATEYPTDKLIPKFAACFAWNEADPRAITPSAWVRDLLGPFSL